MPPPPLDPPVCTEWLLLNLPAEFVRLNTARLRRFLVSIVTVPGLHVSIVTVPGLCFYSPCPWTPCFHSHCPWTPCFHSHCPWTPCFHSHCPGTPCFHSPCPWTPCSALSPGRAGGTTPPPLPRTCSGRCPLRCCVAAVPPSARSPLLCYRPVVSGLGPVESAPGTSLPFFRRWPRLWSRRGSEVSVGGGG